MRRIRRSPYGWRQPTSAPLAGSVKQNVFRIGSRRPEPRSARESRYWNVASRFTTARRDPHGRAMATPRLTRNVRALSEVTRRSELEDGVILDYRVTFDRALTFSVNLIPASHQTDDRKPLAPVNAGDGSWL
jgi:hypothetical protein